MALMMYVYWPGKEGDPLIVPFKDIYCTNLQSLLNQNNNQSLLGVDSFSIYADLDLVLGIDYAHKEILKNIIIHGQIRLYLGQIFIFFIC